MSLADKLARLVCIVNMESGSVWLVRSDLCTVRLRKIVPGHFGEQIEGLGVNSIVRYVHETFTEPS